MYPDEVAHIKITRCGTGPLVAVAYGYADAGQSQATRAKWVMATVLRGHYLKSRKRNRGALPPALSVSGVSPTRARI